MLDDPVHTALPANSSIHVEVFRGAGPDFQLAFPAEPDYSPIPEPEPEPVREEIAQCSLAQAFSKPFDSIVPGAILHKEKHMCNSDQLTNPAMLCKRFLECTTFNLNPNTQQIFMLDDPFTMDHHYLKLLSYTFVFWRGSRRIYYCRINPTNFARIWPQVEWDNVEPIFQPAVLERAGNDPFGTVVEVPYYACSPYLFISNYPYTGEPFKGRVTWICETSPTGAYYRSAAGDDLVMGMLTAPRCCILPSSLHARKRQKS